MHYRENNSNERKPSAKSSESKLVKVRMIVISFWIDREENNWKSPSSSSEKTVTEIGIGGTSEQTADFQLTFLPFFNHFGSFLPSLVMDLVFESHFFRSQMA
jgi:hypothetical protein